MRNRHKPATVKMVTRICTECGDHFEIDPAAPRSHPDFPGFCDGCGAKHEQPKPDIADALWSVAHTMKEMDSFLVPVTASDPRPWLWLEEEFTRPRWAGFKFEVRQVRRGYRYSNGHVEPADGARVWLLAGVKFEEVK